MRIKKTTETTPISSEVVNTQSNSTTDGYSAKYINNLHSYSSTEHIVGTWVDGTTPIYSKTINVGALPNNSEIRVNVDITNLGDIVSLSGVGISTSNKNSFPIPYLYTSSYIELVYIGADSQLRISTNSDRSNLNGYITIEYTKSN